MSFFIFKIYFLFLSLKKIFLIFFFIFLKNYKLMVSKFKQTDPDNSFFDADYKNMNCVIEP